MKNLAKKWTGIICILLFISCGENSQRVTENENPPIISTATADVQDKGFNDLFKEIKVTEITDNVFKLVGSDYTTITAGKKENFNSMIASYGGWGILFENPVTWCFLRASRYTLEIMKNDDTYTMCYFEDIHKDEFMKFGMKSGRNTEKMKDTELTSVETPAGNMTYKEAKLVIECKLSQLTTVLPDDFLTEKGKNFVIEGFEDAGEYHKLVFGEITHVWIRK